MIPVPIDAPPALVRSIGDANLGVLVARRQWPSSPCNGREHVVVTFSAPDVANQTTASGVAAGISPAGSVPWGFTFGSCTVWVRAGLNRQETCTTVAHEMGHAEQEAEGRPYGHTETGLMAPNADPDYAPCRAPRP